LKNAKSLVVERVETTDNGANLAWFDIMIVIAGLLVAGIGSLTLILRELRKAPEAYEDEYGFRMVCKRAVGSGVRGSMITKTRETRSSGHRPMPHAPAHPAH
jgi:hypothetical protein